MLNNSLFLVALDFPIITIPILLVVNNGYTILSTSSKLGIYRWLKTKSQYQTQPIMVNIYILVKPPPLQE